MRVMVVGAGAGGLAALRSLSRQADRLSFVAYEQSDRVGGTWIHNDPHKPTSMYDNLRWAYVYLLSILCVLYSAVVL